MANHDYFLALSIEQNWVDPQNEEVDYTDKSLISLYVGDDRFLNIWKSNGIFHTLLWVDKRIILRIRPIFQ